MTMSFARYAQPVHNDNLDLFKISFWVSFRRFLLAEFAVYRALFSETFFIQRSQGDPDYQVEMILYQHIVLLSNVFRFICQKFFEFCTNFGQPSVSHKQNRYLMQWICLFVLGLFISRTPVTGVLLGSLIVAGSWLLLKPIKNVTKGRLPAWARWIWLPGLLHLKKRGYEMGMDASNLIQRRFSDSAHPHRVTAHNFHRNKSWNRLPIDVVTFRSSNDRISMHALKQRKYLYFEIISVCIATSNLNSRYISFFNAIFPSFG